MSAFDKIPPAPPRWFVVCLVLAYVALGFAMCTAEPEPSSQAFLFLLGNWLWTGLSFLFRLFGGGLDKIIQALEWTRNRLWDLQQGATWGFFLAGKIFKDVVSVFRTLWTGILRPAFDGVWSFVRGVSTRLDRWLSPVVKLIRRIREEVLAVYEKFVRPVLDGIDVARRVLRMFAELGADWARELERKLAEIQERIEEPFRIVLGKLNEALGWINRIVTLDGLLQRLTLFRSLFAYRRELSNFTVNTGFRASTPQEEARLRTPGVPIPVERHVTELRQALAGAPIPLTAKAAEFSADVIRLIGRGGFGFP